MRRVAGEKDAAPAPLPGDHASKRSWPRATLSLRPA